MRCKPVLSHSPPLFPTLCAVAITALFPVLSTPAFAQTVVPRPPPPSVFSTEDAPTVVRAEHIFGRPERYAEFDGNVEVVKGETTFKADNAVYHNVEDEFDAKGNVSLKRAGGCYNGDTLKMKIDSGVGYVLRPLYTIQRQAGQPAKGHAERIDFQSEERSTVTNGTYTTCQSLDPDWYLKADSLKLDTGLDKGVARGSVVYFKKVPILATPSFLPLSFPLSGARQSGLLSPIYTSSTRGGFELTLPYYFNIAPNRDLTISPRLIARRGLHTAFEGRYLGENYAGETTIEGLPNDQQTSSKRYWLDTKHSQSFSEQLNLSWNVKVASDDNYAIDFFDSINKTAEHLLLRDISATYFGSFWSVGLRASQYQVLQDVSDPIADPYRRLPQLSFHAAKQDVMGFDWSVESLLTRFSHPTLVNGDRAVLNQQISFPINQPGYFLIPTAQLHVARYQLNNNLAPGQKANQQVVVPTFSADSGLVFERDANVFGQHLTQTLEPRLFYVYTPYRNQSAIPLFDTANINNDFNLSQIFSGNRFSGQDRIGDANEITATLTTRYIEDNGNERAKFAIGQRFYFDTERVTLNNSVNPSRSDLLLAGSGRITDHLSADVATQISQSDRRALRSNYSVTWQPASRSVLNVGYNFQRDSLQQLTMSTQWPVAKRLFAVGRVNYSLLDKKLVDSLAGFEYKQDCWAVRFVGQRFAANTNSSPTHFFLQLELNGLSSLGSNPLQVLKSTIVGYQSTN